MGKEVSMSPPFARFLGRKRIVSDDRPGCGPRLKVQVLCDRECPKHEAGKPIRYRCHSIYHSLAKICLARVMCGVRVWHHRGACSPRIGAVMDRARLASRFCSLRMFSRVRDTAHITLGVFSILIASCSWDYWNTRPLYSSDMISLLGLGL